MLRSPVCFDEAKNGDLVLFACSHIVCRGCYARLIRGPPAGANCAHCKSAHLLLGILRIWCIEAVRTRRCAATAHRMWWLPFCIKCRRVFAVAAQLGCCLRWCCLYRIAPMLCRKLYSVVSCHAAQAPCAGSRCWRSRRGAGVRPRRWASSVLPRRRQPRLARQQG